MRSSILAFALGVLICQGLTALPTTNALVFIAILAVLCCGMRIRTSGAMQRALLLCAALLAGFSWAAVRAEWRLADELPMQQEGRDLTVVGVIDGLPQMTDGVRRFVFKVEAAEAQVPRRIRLGWYPQRGTEAVGPVPQPGERWQLTVRLKRPHGSSNPGGFDYEAWLFERGIRATGYVRNGGDNRRLDAFVPGFMNRVHQARAAVQARFIEHLDGAPQTGLLVALAVGDQGGIGAEQWKTLRRTAVGHLIAISGLHVSLVALAAGGLVSGCWRRSATLTLRIPARRVGAIAAFVAALAYALMAGMGLPVRRAITMLAVVVIALLTGRQAATSRALSLALLCTLLLDPWSVLSAGFWLSFGAVTVIFLVLGGRLEKAQGIRSAVRIQLAITLALAPMLYALFGLFSFAGPLANAFAIPLVSFIIAPLTLLAMLLPWPWILHTAHLATAWMMRALDWLADQPLALWHGPQVPWPLILLAGLGCLCLLMPRGTPGRFVALCMCLPMLLWQPSRPQPGAMQATVLDVGQGLAVYVQTARHALLFDTGPRYGAHADAGERVLIPALRAAGVRQLDGVVLSHGDADHVGGADSLFKEIPSRRIWGGADVEGQYEDCVADTAWEWDGVQFRFLHPAADDRLEKRNDGSCVLQLTANGGSLLLPGDISMTAERILLERQGAALASEVVVAPHHGSKSSSSPAFVTAVAAEHVIHSVGMLNRYRHPHPDVWARWDAAGARNWRTDGQGAIRLEIDEQGVRIASWREENRRYWHGR
ncbi:MAG TPA: DNA internalization-related competence protein ComEC/Rec2 [Azoarcus sp.]|nr:DNA internalization-related competence protein ComEC/Rec2 [Azoarcus sp.]